MKIRITFSFLIFFSCISINAQQIVADTLVNKTKVVIPLNSILTYSIVNSTNYTFGYHIYLNEKTLIKQLTIPGLNGQEGFKTKVDAEKIAQLVIDKIRNGKMPPSITMEEMKNLNVLSK
jgi:hypothetical protein